ncbi:unnamed protein product [Ectocarpus sp. 12 AP-2014]
MRGALSTVLAAAGGTHAIAFVNPAGWAPPRIKSSKSWGRGVQNLKAQQTLTLDVDSSMIARPDKAARGGDDAYFVNAGDSGALDLGVFDGVGGWASLGHDPGVFSRGFAKATAANITAQRAEEAVSLRRSQLEGEPLPRIAQGVDLQQALEYATTNAALAGTQGTCTACVVTFDPVYGMLNGVNVGDSGALLVRRDARGTLFVALRTATQRHNFNQPYQLGTGSRDKAHDAREFLFYVREGDLVVLATDGLLDNMFESDILRCIEEASEGDAQTTAHESCDKPVDLASALARRAFSLSRDKERLTPWEEEAVAAGVIPTRGFVDGPSTDRGKRGLEWDASKWGLALERSVTAGLNSFRQGAAGAPKQDDRRESIMPEEDTTSFRGGKMDDITVLVATVRRAGSLGRKATVREGADARTT